MNTQWDHAQAVLGRRVVLAGLDPWTASLVTRLSRQGALPIDQNRMDLAKPAATSFDAWVLENPEDPRRVRALAIRDEILNEAFFGKQLRRKEEEIREWLGELLLDRLDWCGTRVVRGGIRVVYPELLPQDPEECAADAVLWWERRLGS